MKRTFFLGTMLALLPACSDDSPSSDSGGASTGGSTGEGDGSTSGGDGASSGGDGVDGSTSDGDTTSTGGSSGTDDSTGETGDPLEPPDVQDHAGGGARVVASTDTHAYVGMGPRVTVWDIQSGSMPTLVGRSEPLPGLVSGIALSGGRAYVTTMYDLSGELYILDIEEPTAPSIVGAHAYTDATYTNPTDVVAGPAHLYLSDTEVGISSFDLSNPDAPELVDRLEVVSIDDIDLEGNRLRYVDQNFQGIATVGTVASADGVLTPVGSIQLPDPGSTTEISGNLAFRAGFYGFFGYDISDPNTADPVLANDSALGTVVGTTARAAYHFTDSGVRAYDLTSSPPSEGTLVLTPTVRAAAVGVLDRAMLAWTDRGYGFFFDTTDPLNPVPGGTIDLPVGADPVSVAIDGENLFVADFYTGLRIVRADDFSDVGRFDSDAELSGYEDVDVAGGFAYLADWASGLDIVDISDPANPTLVSHLTTGGFPSAVDVHEGVAYVGESTQGGAVRVIDVSEPARPEQRGVVATSKVRDLAYFDGHVYVADESVDSVGGFRIIDVTDPDAPVEVAHDTTCGSALGVAVDARYAYLACADDNRVHVFDVSDPEAPAPVTAVDFGQTGLVGVAVIGQRLYVGHAYGTTEFDLTDPESPSVMRVYEAGLTVRRLAVRDDGAVYAAAGIAGVYRLQ